MSIIKLKVTIFNHFTMLSKLFALFSSTKNIGCREAIVSFLDTASLRVTMAIIKLKVTIFNHFAMLSSLFALFFINKNIGRTKSMVSFLDTAI